MNQDKQKKKMLKWMNFAEKCLTREDAKKAIRKYEKADLKIRQHKLVK